MLEEMPRFILDGELIVGSRTLFAPQPDSGGGDARPSAREAFERTGVAEPGSWSAER